MAGFFDEINSRLRRLPKPEPELRRSATPSNPNNNPELWPANAPTYPSVLDPPSRAQPLWLDPDFTSHIVKGNLTILCTKPSAVELGEWIAHQIVEHFRLLQPFTTIVHEKDNAGRRICNCPSMSAGKNSSYSWRCDTESIYLPAHKYMTLVEQWISSKIDDPKIFPTDLSSVSSFHNPAFASSMEPTDKDCWIGKRSGFPENFESICRIIFRHMFRIYAHLFWNHFVEPLYHLNLESSLNSAFAHFLTTAIDLDMLDTCDLQPMQPLLNLFAASGVIPSGSKAYQLAQA